MRKRIIKIYVSICYAMFAATSQSFTVWLFVCAWRMVQVSGAFHGRGAKLFVLAAVAQILVLPFVVWAVFNLAVSLLKYPREPSIPRRRLSGKLSMSERTLCLACLVPILTLAVFVVACPGSSLAPAIVNVLLRIAMGLTIPPLIWCIVGVCRTSRGCNIRDGTQAGLQAGAEGDGEVEVMRKQYK